MCYKRFHNAIAWTLSLTLALAASTVALAQDQSKGRIVRIGPDDQGQNAPALPAPDNDAAQIQQPAVPPYWIGLLGGPITPELRAHIDLPEDQGLLVREIVPNSPAAKSGLKLYDILLRANDTQLHEMRDLVELVRTEGQKEGQITLEVLRKGQRQSITVKPEARPAQVAQNQGGFGQGDVWQGFQPDNGQVPMMGQIPELRRFFEGLNGNGQMEFRQFGPGVIVGGNGGGGAANLPNGVSVSIKKENNQPAHITVKRGNQTWEAVEGDEDSLDNLPADLRPSIDRMLNGAHGNRLDFNMNDVAPQMFAPGTNERSLLQRLETLERQIQQLTDKQQRDSGKPADGQAK